LTDEPARPSRLPQAARLWRYGLAAGYLTILGLNLPGHLSADSVISLWEGRSGVRMVWGPPMYSAILGFFDRIVPGASLYLAACALLIFASWAGLRTLRPRTAWTGPALLAGVLLLPIVLVYQGTVWKDVLFANLTIAGFVCLAHAALRFGTRRRWAPLAGALVFFAFGCLVRQNGAITTVFAAMALAWAARGGGWRASALWGLAGFAAPLALAALLNTVTPVRTPPDLPKLDQGVRMVQHYDIAAAVAADPKRPLKALEADNPAATAVLRLTAREAYSPVRSDEMKKSKPFMESIWSYSGPAVSTQWRQIVFTDPTGYVWRRLQIFRWVFMTPRLELCLPVHLGSMGPPEVEAKLGMPTQVERRDSKLFNYATWFFWSPASSHVFWAIAALACIIALLHRRQGADVAVAAMLGSALAFGGSFAMISIACDYRYLYLVDLSAITGLLYLALDPPTIGRRRRAEASP